jgi:PGF-pre-PGF domain-containing protein
VNSTPEGSVYKYINIWVGKFGFATETNIKDPKVKFKVAKSWLQDMGINLKKKAAEV